MSAQTAAALVDRYVTMLMRGEALVRSIDWRCDKLIDEHMRVVGEGWDGFVPDPAADSAARSLEAAHPRLAQETWFCAADTAVRRLWQRHRIVYDIHPDVWAALADTEPTTVIPAGLLGTLPHPDPFIVLPEPIRMPMADGNYQHVGGFFVSGRGPGWDKPDEVQFGMQTSTADPDLRGLALLFCGPAYTPQGRPALVLDDAGQDAIWTRVSIVLGGVTVEDMVANVKGRFVSLAERSEGFGVEHWHREVEILIRAAVSVLVYLCATNADLRPVAASRSRAAVRGTRTVKPPKVVEVGYRVGAALRAHRRAETAAASTPTGRTVTPHVRRAHFHTYKVGPGRTESRVRWLAPIPVKFDGVDADRSVVVPVD